MGSTRKPLLLWFDLTSGAKDTGLRIQCTRVFDVERTTRLARASQDIERLRPSVVCFDFDHPDQDRLRAMQAVKKAHPRIPLLMMTLDHSESLAVWAFRARVWNYLVKPVAPAEFEENLQALARIVDRGTPPRVPQTLEAAVPEDLPAQPVDPAVARLQPALHYVKRHYHEKISEEVAARCCGMSRCEFSRKFHAAFGMTFREHLLRARITEARRMLMEGQQSVTAIAYSVGFNDGSHFARMFRRYTHVLPSAYQMSGTGAHRLPLLPDGARSQWSGGAAPGRQKADRRRLEMG